MLYPQLSLRKELLSRLLVAYLSILCVQIFDLMGYEPSHVNKINIHIGGQYGTPRPC